MRFKFFGAEIRLSFLFCAAISVMICIDRTGLMIPVLIAAAIHETGHLFTLWLYDCPPVRIDLVPAAVRIVRRGMATDENVIVTALAGPLINISFAFCAGLNWYLYKKTFVLYFAAANAALGLFNLLPASGLDGGTVLYTLLSKHISHFAAKTVVRAISIFLALAAAAAGVYLYSKERFNLSVFTAAIYLFFCALCENRE